MALERDMENFRSMIDNLIAGIGFFRYEDGNLTPLYVNEGFFRMLGYSRSQGMRYLQNVRRSIIPEDIPILEQGIADVLKDDGYVEIEFRTVTGSGNLRWLQVRGNLYEHKGRSWVIVSVIQDVTERKNIELELQKQADQLYILSETAQEKILDYNAKSDVAMIYTTGDFGRKEEVILNDYMRDFPTDMLHEEDVAYYRSVLEGLLKSPRHDTMEFRTKRFDGDYTWYQANLTSLLGGEGYVTRIVGRLMNIHEKKLREIDLILRAEKDALTGLYNKGATEQLIQNAIAETQDENVFHAMLMIDLDGFKEVNDTLGHMEGDKVLAKVTGILNETVRGSDIVGRIGGDEFLIFMEKAESPGDAELLASRLVEQLHFFLPWEEEGLEVTCSIGVSLYPYHGTTYEDLFEKADKAVYTVKANGKNDYRIYDAANTMAYYASRKSIAHSAETDEGLSDNIEDMLMHILYEEKTTVSALKSALELMVRKYGFHRGYLCNHGLFSSAREGMNVFYAAPGYEAGRESMEHYNVKQIVAETLFESYKSLTVLHDYDMTVEELRYYLQSEGIKSMLYYPMTAGGEYRGALIMENREDVQFELAKADREELCSVLRVLEAQLLQVGLMDKMQDFITQIRLFDNTDDYIYVINPDTYQITFLNKKVLMQTPEVKIGDICYQALQQRDTPCQSCILQQLNRMDPHARHTEELFNYSLRCWTRCGASWLACNKEQALAIVNMIDISEYFIG